jgi:hypothetical protein
MQKAVVKRENQLMEIVQTKHTHLQYSLTSTSMLDACKVEGPETSK